MKRREIGRGALGLLALGLVAAPAVASDVETEPQGQTAVESEMETGHTEMPAAPADDAVAGWVERAAFTTAVVDREPQDAVDTLTSDHVEVYFFTELRGLEGQTVTHRWEYDGQVMAEVPFDVGGPRWRTYSSKQLQPGQVGQWTASVVDGSGRVLLSRSFAYREPEPETMPAAPQP